MYPTLLILHSLIRWAVLAALLFAIFRAARGYVRQSPFSSADNAIRHWTATIGHIQLTIGLILYIKSPLIQFFWGNMQAGMEQPDAVFFGLIHFLLMLCAIVILTLGSAFAKRQETDHAKYRTMLIWFCVALCIILIAIPWPFSPLAHRPYLRAF